LAALLVLLAQLPAALDSHSPTRTVQADSGECALCLFAFHTPAQPASGPALANPRFELRYLAPAEPQPGPWRTLTSPFSRAPPYLA
jgi:hypothetical protein